MSLIRPRAFSRDLATFPFGVLPVSKGGTGATSLTDNGVVYGNGADPVGVTAEGATGTLLGGQTGSPPAFQTGQVAAEATSLGYVRDDLAALKALTSRPPEVLIKTGKGAGVWSWTSGNQSANVTADPLEALWAAPDSAPTGASGAWQRVYDGYKNGKWWGALGDNSADDTAAIQAAVRSAGAIYFPPGIYRYTAFDMDVAGTTLLGAGQGVTIFRATTASAQHIRMVGGEGLIYNLTLDASVTQSGGFFVGMGSVGPNIVDTVEFDAPYVGVSIGVGLSQVRNSLFKNIVATTGRGIEVLFGEGLQLVNNVLTCPLNAQPEAGIKVIRCDDLQGVGNQIYGCGADLKIVPTSAAAVGSVQFSNTYFDTANNGLWIAPTGSQQVLRCSFSQCWFGNHANDGILLSGSSGVISGLQFDGCLIVNNGTDGSGSGVVTFGASVGCIKDVVFSGCIVAGNKDNGIALSAGCRSLTIVGNHIGFLDGFVQNGNNVGIYDNGCDDYLIADNNLLGNITQALVGYTSSPLTRIVRNNLGFVTENRGTGTINSGATSATIAHGLSVTPAAGAFSVNFTENPTNDPGNAWISGIGATNFTVNVRSDPGASNLDFAWAVRVV